MTPLFSDYTRMLAARGDVLRGIAVLAVTITGAIYNRAIARQFITRRHHQETPRHDVTI